MYMVRNLEIRNCKLCLFYLSLFILIKLSIFEFPLHYSYTNKFKSTIFHHFFRFFFFFFYKPQRNVKPCIRTCSPYISFSSHAKR